jgi:hypothetical protein
MAAVAQKDERDASVVLVAIHNGGCSSAMAVVVVNFLLDEIPLPSPVYSTDWYTHAFAFFLPIISTQRSITWYVHMLFN